MMEALLAVTYRCNAKCRMCNIWKGKGSKEIRPETFRKLPSGLRFTNITGGEPFLREDIEDIVRIVRPKTQRLVISTNGYFTERITALARRHPDLGFRVSIEGLPEANDALRGIRSGFDHGLRTLLELHQMGVKDIGFGITVSDRNAGDLLELYRLSKWLGLEFATAAIHNTFYFQKHDNRFSNRKAATDEFKKLTVEMLSSSRPKEWFRAFFNYGLVNYINGNKRLLPCEMGSDVFFMDPSGEIYPCNGMKASMGNIRRQGWGDIWHGRKAEEAREKVKRCTKECWMVGSAAPAIKKAKLKALSWIIKSKLSKPDFAPVEER
jgi:Fe-coproporphyrin III synthase